MAPDSLGDIREFTTTLYGTAQGRMCLFVGYGGYFDTSGAYKFSDSNETWFAWPDEMEHAAREIMQARELGDAYVGTCVYKTAERRQGNAVAHNVIHTDVDNGHLDLDKVRALGGFAIGSGTPGNGHAYVRVAGNPTGPEFTVLERGARKYFDGDNKISDNDVLRPPGTFNHKNAARGGEPTLVKWLRRPSGAWIDKQELATRLGVDLSLATVSANGQVAPVDLAAYPRVAAALRQNTGDRSADTMRVVGVCYREHLQLPQVRSVISSRADLAERLRGRNDDDVLTCWLKAIDDRQSRAADEDLVFGAHTTGQTDPNLNADSKSDKPETLLAGIHTAAWLDGQDLPELEIVVPGLIAEGLGILVAPPKTGKSWLVADVGLAVSCGGVALGTITVTKRPVLYLALEDGNRRLQSRFRRIMGNQPQPTQMFYVTKAKRSEVVAMILEFLSLHGDEKPLIILDTLGRARPPRRAGDDTYQADYDYGVSLKDAIDSVPGAALLVVHHTRKAESKDFVDMVSGSHGIAGSADYVIVLDRKRHSEDGLLSISGRDVPEGEYAVHADQGVLWRLDGPDLPAAAATATVRRERSRLGERQFVLLMFVNSRPETTPGDVAGLLDITPKQAGNALAELSDSGRIRRLRRGVYTKAPESPESPENAGQNVYPFSGPEKESPENDGSK